MKKNNITLVSFADDRFLFSQSILNYSARKHGIKKICSFSPKDFENTTFYEENKYILEQKRGHGYWLWKPWIILQTLKDMNNGDFLLYADSGSFIIRSVDPLINLCRENNGLLLFENEHQYINLHWFKKMALDLMDVNVPEFLQKTQANAAFLVIQKNEFTLNFINEWFKYCKNPDILTDSQSLTNESSDFVEHRHDQAVLSALAFKHNITFFRDPSQHGNYRKTFLLREFCEYIGEHKYSHIMYNSPYRQIFCHHRLNPSFFKYKKISLLMGILRSIVSVSNTKDKRFKRIKILNGIIEIEIEKG